MIIEVYKYFLILQIVLMEGNIEIIIVLISLIAMLALLVADVMRPGLVMLSAAILFMCTGILTPEELMSGFSNKGMITVALLFLVSEGVRRSDALGHVIGKIMPAKRIGGSKGVRNGYLHMMPTVAAISAFLNNTPLVVIFTPIIKEWASKIGQPVKKFLIPLSYASILGGMCTLIGTSTNLVVHGLMLDAGYSGLTMFELAKVGGFIAIAGIAYIVLFGNRLLPSDKTPEETLSDSGGGRIRIEAVLGPRFRGINCLYKEFDFEKRYGARIVELRRNGEAIADVESTAFREGDTLILNTHEEFFTSWGESSEFLMLSNGKPRRPHSPKWKKWAALSLLTIMVAGATFGQIPEIKALLPEVNMDMFFWACIVTVIMAALNLFPAKKYTKFISWDILITIASALAISKAMTNSGLADLIAEKLTMLSGDGTISPIIVLAALYITTNIITELITNNAAAAFAFPVAMSTAVQLGVNPMPFFIAICIAASASFSSPIGYQTNMIAQGIGNYKFRDFTRIGLPLNIISFILSMILIPIFWKF